MSIDRWRVVSVSVQASGYGDYSGLTGRVRYDQFHPEVLVTIEAYMTPEQAQEVMSMSRGPVYRSHTTDSGPWPGTMYSEPARRTKQPPKQPEPPKSPALEPPRKRTWREVLEDGKPITTKAEAKARYRKRAKQDHPDHGGRTEVMAELNQAIKEALKDLVK